MPNRGLGILVEPGLMRAPVWRGRHCSKYIAIAEGVTAAIGMPSAIKLWAIAAGLLVSASVGIFFGVYPARKAAKLDPIVALRFEL